MFLRLLSPLQQSCVHSLCPPVFVYTHTVGFIRTPKQFVLAFFFSCNIFSLAEAGGHCSGQLLSESCSGNCLQLKKASWPSGPSPLQGRVSPKTVMSEVSWNTQLRLPCLLEGGSGKLSRDLGCDCTCTPAPPPRPPLCFLHSLTRGDAEDTNMCYLTFRKKDDPSVEL